MSNTNRIMTLGDVRDKKALIEADKLAMDDKKQAPKIAKRKHEDEMLARYPQIGVLQGARGRKFYAYVNGDHNEAFRSSDIDKVVEAVQNYVAGPLPIGDPCPGQTVTFIGGESSL